MQKLGMLPMLFKVMPRRLVFFVVSVTGLLIRKVTVARSLFECEAIFI